MSHSKILRLSSLASASALAALLAGCGGGSGDSASASSSASALQAAARSRIVANPVPVIPPVRVPIRLDPGPIGTAYPIVFNASSTIHPGEVASLQGAQFTSSATVYMEGAPDAPLEIVNRSGSDWIGVKIPASATGAIVVRVKNATGTSAQVKLNAAAPMHLDAMTIVPGGAFRVFGRNLLVPGSTPKLTVDGVAAAIDLSRSDERMLVATAPAGLQATSASAIVADNGNGSGSSQLDRAIKIDPMGKPDVFGVGVGWAGAFTAVASRSVNASTDPRLPSRMACDGSTDDTPAIQSAIDLAASLGGAVVALPAGTCRMAHTMNLRSNVVVQGAGKDATNLVYDSNYPVYGVGLDLIGLRSLTLTNSGSSGEGPQVKDNTRVLIQGVRFAVGTSRQMYLSGNAQFAVKDSEFLQRGSISGQGPYILADSAGLLFEGNLTQWVDGAPSFTRVHDSYVHSNRFTRDGSFQNAQGGTVHSMVIDFAHRLAIDGNTFDVANGPIYNTNRNDGETILTEGGGASRTESLGHVAAADASTFSDPSNALNVDPFSMGSIPENYGVAIVGGKGAGQTRRIVSYSGSTATVDKPWDVVPDSTSAYSTFVWGLEKSMIRGNQLSQNPRGIWIYQTAARQVDVVGNSMSEGGGIFLRTYQNLAAKSFLPQYGVLVAGNSVSNANGRWMSYVNAVFANTDAQDFGVAQIGLEIRSNSLTANVPNVSSQYEDYASTEGFMNMMRVENYGPYVDPAIPRLLGTIMQSNSCANCDFAVRVGTGSGGATILDTVQTGGGTLWTDWATTSGPQKSTDTLVR